MNKNYLIYDIEIGILSKNKHSVTGEDGTKRNSLVYWRELKHEENIKFYYLTALLQKWIINILSRNIKPMIITQKELDGTYLDKKK